MQDIVKYLLHTHWYIIRNYCGSVMVLTGSYSFKHEVNISVLHQDQNAPPKPHTSKKEVKRPIG